MFINPADFGDGTTCTKLIKIGVPNWLALEIKVYSYIYRKKHVPRLV